MNIKKIGIIALGLMLFVGVGVFAANNPAVVDIKTVDCGETTFTASITDPDGRHKVANMRLIVHVDSTTDVSSNIPTDGNEVNINVGPFTENQIIKWRVFGGGERDYDMPLWNGYGGCNFKSDIVEYNDEYVAEYGAENNWKWTLSSPEDTNPFTKWNEVSVEGCPQQVEKEIISNRGGQRVIPWYQNPLYAEEWQDFKNEIKKLEDMFKGLLNLFEQNPNLLQ